MVICEFAMLRRTSLSMNCRLTHASLPERPVAGRACAAWRGWRARREEAPGGTEQAASAVTRSLTRPAQVIPDLKVKGPTNQAMLDYRCHAPGEKIGTAFPSEVVHCLREFVRSTPEQLRLRYLLPRHDQVRLTSGSRCISLTVLDQEKKGVYSCMLRCA